MQGGNMALLVGQNTSQYIMIHHTPTLSIILLMHDKSIQFQVLFFRLKHDFQPILQPTLFLFQLIKSPSFMCLVSPQEAIKQKQQEKSIRFWKYFNYLLKSLDQVWFYKCHNKNTEKVLVIFTLKLISNRFLWAHFFLPFTGIIFS